METVETKEPVVSLDEADDLSKRMITLKLEDGLDTWQVSALECKNAEFFKNLLEDKTCQEIVITKDRSKNPDGTELVRDKIDPKTFSYLPVYLRAHVKAPATPVSEPIPTDDLSVLFSTNDDDLKLAKILKADIELNMTLLLLANYVGCDGLVRLCSAVFSSHLLGQSPETIRKIFNISGDYTPEEEEKVYAEHADLLERAPPSSEKKDLKRSSSSSEGKEDESKGQPIPKKARVE